MVTFWRISDHVDLGGWGGKKFSSRWTSLGKRVVYFAESPAGAMLEVLVHFTGDFNANEQRLPRIYTLLRIESGDGAAVRDLGAPAAAQWRERPDQTQRIGDAWLASGETPLARVPSAIVPRTWNYLLNPEHPDAKHIQIAEVIKERFDNRLFRFGTR
jgi:RES domain-containing protein